MLFELEGRPLPPVRWDVEFAIVKGRRPINASEELQQCRPERPQWTSSAQARRWRRWAAKNRGEDLGTGVSSGEPVALHRFGGPWHWQHHQLQEGPSGQFSVADVQGHKDDQRQCHQGGVGGNQPVAHHRSGEREHRHVKNHQGGQKGGLHPQPPQPCRGTGVSDGALSFPFKRFSSKFVSPERRETNYSSSGNNQVANNVAVPRGRI